MTALDVRIEQEVTALSDLLYDELVAHWMKAYGCPPPKGVKRGLLERAAAWHLQARRLGGLSPASRKTISEAVKRVPVPGNMPSGEVAGAGDTAETDIAVEHARSARRHNRPVIPAPALQPGTRLMREWNGRAYVVDVAEKGFVLDGKTYRSLSAIAKRITGAHWSGPRFFGI